MCVHVCAVYADDYVRQFLLMKSCSVRKYSLWTSINTFDVFINAQLLQTNCWDEQVKVDSPSPAVLPHV